MDLGLGNLITLKKHLLPSSLRSQTTYDDVIAALGKGVAKWFDRHCNRLFSYAAGDTCEFRAWHFEFFLPRFPVVQISSVDVKENETDGWVSKTVSDVILQSGYATGWIYMGTSIGVYTSLVRITYDGGYWYDTTEDGTGTQPSGSTALPDDLQQAWLMQCQHAWSKMDRLGKTVQNDPAAYGAAALAGIDMLPAVDKILSHYIRYAML